MPRWHSGQLKGLSGGETWARGPALLLLATTRDPGGHFSSLSLGLPVCRAVGGLDELGRRDPGPAQPSASPAHGRGGAFWATTWLSVSVLQHLLFTAGLGISGGLLCLPACSFVSFAFWLSWRPELSVCPSLFQGPLCLCRSAAACIFPGLLPPRPVPGCVCLHLSVFLQPVLLPEKSALGRDGWSIRGRLTGVCCLEQQLLQGRREVSE